MVPSDTVARLIPSECCRRSRAHMPEDLRNQRRGCNGSISEYLTLSATCSGDEGKAEPICCLIYSVFSSQFGHKRPFVRKEKPRRRMACLRKPIIQTIGCNDLCGSLWFALRSAIGAIWRCGKDKVSPTKKNSGEI